MEIKQIENFKIDEVKTMHFDEHRQSRQNAINEIFSIEGKNLNSTYWVDKNHPNGAEIHQIYENGIIEIFNERTQKHITTLIARKNQLIRYNSNLPKSMLNKAIKHEQKGLNYL